VATKKTLDELLAEEVDSPLLDVKPRAATAPDGAARADPVRGDQGLRRPQQVRAGRGPGARKIGIIERYPALPIRPPSVRDRRSSAGRVSRLLKFIAVP
jgi:hypothetical protein